MFVLSTGYCVTKSTREPISSNDTNHVIVDLGTNRLETILTYALRGRCKSVSVVRFTLNRQSGVDNPQTYPLGYKEDFFWAVEYDQSYGSSPKAQMSL